MLSNENAFSKANLIMSIDFFYGIYSSNMRDNCVYCVAVVVAELPDR